MTQEELIEYITKNDSGKTVNGFDFKFQLKHFENQVYIIVDNIPNINSEPKISLLNAFIRDLQSFNPNSTDWFRQEIYNHFKFTMTDAWFGMVNYKEFENEEEANIEYFKIYNEKDACNAIQLTVISIWLNDSNKRNFELIFSCPWENEHGITLGVSNGQFQYIE